ncbi:hypothetical protein PENTCL1PPCAC_8005, partial [Pristionchus entomophagus]
IMRSLLLLFLAVATSLCIDITIKNNCKKNLQPHVEEWTDIDMYPVAAHDEVVNAGTKATFTYTQGNGVHVKNGVSGKNFAGVKTWTTSSEYGISRVAGYDTGIRIGANNAKLVPPLTCKNATCFAPRHAKVLYTNYTGTFIVTFCP